VFLDQLAAGVSVLATLVASAVPIAQEREGSASSEELRVGTYGRYVYEQDVLRVAVADDAVLSFEILSPRELLAHARARGRTNALFWFQDGTTATVEFAVVPDLSVLQRALADLHPAIRVEPAPDRDAIVLRGVVASAEQVRAAEALAQRYLGADDVRAPLVGAAALEPAEAGDGPEDAGADLRRGEDDTELRRRARATVVNLLRTSALPPRLEAKLYEALVALPGVDVEVQRIVRGEAPVDADDLFVLHGSVPDQVSLARVLHLAAGVIGAEADDAIEVLADEGGALQGTSVRGGGSASSRSGGESLLGSGGVAGIGTSSAAGRLENDIRTNLGRARVVSAAEGRLLSLIEVEDLPLVQVDVRFYEVDLSRLREVGSDLRVLLGDFDQPPLLPGAIATGVQGTGAASVGQDDVQGALGFLDGGLSSQLQLVTGGFAVDALFRVLEAEGVARTLSQPSLTVLSGETARFEVGGQVPVPVALTLGGGTDQVLRGVEFREFGVRLSVRPSVGRSDSITLDVSPAISSPDLQLTASVRDSIGTELATTAFESRAVRTSARLAGGQALLIGGLSSRDAESATSKVPLLGDLPLLGHLFRNDSEQSNEFELVIILRPTVVREPRHDARIWLLPEPARLLERTLERARTERSRTRE